MKWAAIGLGVIVLLLAAGSFTLAARGGTNGTCDRVSVLSAVCGSGDSNDDQAGDSPSTGDNGSGDSTENGNNNEGGDAGGGED
ncbi:MAG: hypothetical protein QOJ13_2967 [Gaiellales bacterium]|jgi:hypothetical protein|nr:hypothetical protein [Gaiellales bacterium]